MLAAVFLLCGQPRPLRKVEAVAGIQVLMLHQNLMNVVGVRWLTCEMVLQHLEDMVQSTRIIDVDIGNTISPLHKKCKLQVAEVVVGLETACRFEVLKLPRKVVQAAVDRMEQPRVNVVLHFFALFLIHKREKTIASKLSNFFDF